LGKGDEAKEVEKRRRNFFIGEKGFDFVDFFLISGYLFVGFR